MISVTYDEEHDRHALVADLFRKFPSVQKALSTAEQNNLTNYIHDRVSNYNFLKFFFAVASHYFVEPLVLSFRSVSVLKPG